MRNHRVRDTCEQRHYAVQTVSEGAYISSSPHVKEQDPDTLDRAAADGAIHGVARGVLDWLTEAHPDEDRARKPRYIHQEQDPDTLDPSSVDGGVHGLAGGVLNWLTETHVVRPEQPHNTSGYGYRCQPPAGGHKSSPAGAGFALSRRDFSVRGNEISNSEGDIAFNFYIVKEGSAVGVSEFGNSHYGGSNGYRQRPLYDY